MERTIVVKSVSLPKDKDMQDEIEWLCRSFGFCNGNSKDPIASRIIQEILLNVVESESVATQTIAQSLGVKPGRVNHHVRGLIGSGFLYRHRKMICLRGGSVRQAVLEMRRDAERIFEDIEKMSEKLDRRIGLLDM